MSPDIVANLRVDQAWGGAQIMGAIHHENTTYYDSDIDAAADLDELSGHPGEKWGWVVGGGLKINAPFISPGDYFVAEVNYTEGALKYINSGESTNDQ